MGEEPTPRHWRIARPAPFFFLRGGRVISQRDREGPTLPAQFLLTRLCEVDDALQRDDFKVRRLRRRAGMLCPLPIWRFLLVMVEVAREVGMTDFAGRKI